MYGHKKFPKIGGLHNVVRTVDYISSVVDDCRTSLDYRAKIKLHGANMAVRLHANGDLFAQSRNQDISVANFQFSAFVRQHESYFKTLCQVDRNIVLYGE